MSLNQLLKRTRETTHVPLITLLETLVEQSRSMYSVRLKNIPHITVIHVYKIDNVNVFYAAMLFYAVMLVLYIESERPKIYLYEYLKLIA